MIIHQKKSINFLFFIFLFLHTVPLIFRENYQMITSVNYSIVLLLLFLISFYKSNINLVSSVMISMIFISFIMTLFGYSGTIFALILAASLPTFLFNNIKSKDELLNIFYSPIIFCSILVIIFSFYLFDQIKDRLFEVFFLGKYFIISSINYVPLLLFSFSVLCYSIIRIKNKNAEKKSKFDFLFLTILLSVTIFFSFIYGTRSVFLVSLIFVFIHLKKFKRLLIPLSLLLIFYNKDQLILATVDFFTINDLSEISEVGKDNRRADSLVSLIKSSMQLEYNFRENMSYSTLINLLFSLFPLSLIYLYHLFMPISIVFKRGISDLHFIYGLSLFITIYQMDFFSIFTLFFLIKFIKFSYSLPKN